MSANVLGSRWERMNPWTASPRRTSVPGGMSAPTPLSTARGPSTACTDAGPRWKATSSSGGSMSAVTVETALGAARRLASWEGPGRAGAYPRARVVSDATVDDA